MTSARSASCASGTAAATGPGRPAGVRPGSLARRLPRPPVADHERPVVKLGRQPGEDFLGLAEQVEQLVPVPDAELVHADSDPVQVAGPLADGVPEGPELVGGEVHPRHIRRAGSKGQHAARPAAPPGRVPGGIRRPAPAPPGLDRRGRGRGVFTLAPGRNERGRAVGRGDAERGDPGLKSGTRLATAFGLRRPPLSVRAVPICRPAAGRKSRRPPPGTARRHPRRTCRCGSGRSSTCPRPGGTTRSRSPRRR